MPRMAAATTAARAPSTRMASTAPTAPTAPACANRCQCRQPVHPPDVLLCQRRPQLRVPGVRLRHRLRGLRIARCRAIVAAACGSTASKDAAHSWQHLGRHALAALAKVNGPSAAGATVRTLATAAIATAAADAPLVAPAELAAAAARRHPSNARLLCSHGMEGHRSPRQDGSICLPALDGLLCDG